MGNDNKKVTVSEKVIRLNINDEYDVLYRKDNYNPVCVRRAILDDIISSSVISNNVVKNKFTEKGILCEKGNKEDSSIRKSLQKMREKYRDNILEIRFVPSYICDEKCGYCLARNALEECCQSFSLSWLDKLIEVTNQYLEIHNEAIDTISFTFIGGEPLLDVNWNICKNVVERFKEYYAEKIKVTTRVITNGNRIDKNFLEKNAQYIDEIYLSFDIRGMMNDETEPKQRNRSDAFFDLLDICLYYIQNITIDLKVNRFTNVSIENLVLSELKDRSMKYGNRLNLAASVIVTREEYDPFSQKHVCKYELKNFKKEGCLEVLKGLKLFFGKRFSFWPSLRHCSVYRCKTSTNNTLMVYPSGKISICGKLYTNVTDEVPYIADLNKGSQIDLNKLIDVNLALNDMECMECDYFFVCGGKCPLMANTSCDEEKEYAKMYIELAALCAVEKGQ